MHNGSPFQARTGRVILKILKWHGPNVWLQYHHYFSSYIIQSHFSNPWAVIVQFGVEWFHKSYWWFGLCSSQECDFDESTTVITHLLFSHIHPKLSYLNVAQATGFTTYSIWWDYTALVLSASTLLDWEEKSLKWGFGDFSFKSESILLLLDGVKKAVLVSLLGICRWAVQVALRFHFMVEGAEQQV